MTRQRQVYVCTQCGNMIEVLRPRAGTLVCCHRPMTVAEENVTDASQEKHVPVIHSAAGEVKVTVGSVAHPMAEDHHIEWVELVHGDAVHRHFLKPGSAPAATFKCGGEGVAARAYCNLHGLWKGTI